jgi:hypothetical protein
MSMQAMLMPVFAQVALTFVLFFWIQFLRLGAVRLGQVPANSVALREPKLASPRHPDWQRLPQSARDAAPLLCAGPARHGNADRRLHPSRFELVVRRLAFHARLHPPDSNRIGARAPVFLVGAIGLALMWIIVAARLTIAAT